MRTATAPDMSPTAIKPVWSFSTNPILSWVAEPLPELQFGVNPGAHFDVGRGVGLCVGMSESVGIGMGFEVGREETKGIAKSGNGIGF